MQTVGMNLMATDTGHPVGFEHIQLDCASATDHNAAAISRRVVQLSVRCRQTDVVNHLNRVTLGQITGNDCNSAAHYILISIDGRIVTAGYTVVTGKAHNSRATQISTIIRRAVHLAAPLIRSVPICGIELMVGPSPQRHSIQLYGVVRDVTAITLLGRVERHYRCCYGQHSQHHNNFLHFNDLQKTQPVNVNGSDYAT